MLKNQDVDAKLRKSLFALRGGLLPRISKGEDDTIPFLTVLSCFQSQTPIRYNLVYMFITIYDLTKLYNFIFCISSAPPFHFHQPLTIPNPSFLIALFSFLCPEYLSSTSGELCLNPQGGLKY